MARRIGGHLVAESLAALGAEVAFGVPGIHALPIWEGLRDDDAISVYGTRTELAAGFDSDQTLVRFLGELGVQLDPFSSEALWHAGQAWRRYTRGRGRQVQCPQCGRRFDVRCPVCRSSIVWRQHVIADFLIGGHAIAQAGALITRDPGYYRTYFPELKLIVPALDSA